MNVFYSSSTFKCAFYMRCLVSFSPTIQHSELSAFGKTLYGRTIRSNHLIIIIIPSSLSSARSISPIAHHVRFKRSMTHISTTPPSRLAAASLCWHKSLYNWIRNPLTIDRRRTIITRTVNANQQAAIARPSLPSTLFKRQGTLHGAPTKRASKLNHTSSIKFWSQLPLLLLLPACRPACCVHLRRPVCVASASKLIFLHTTTTI